MNKNILLVSLAFACSHIFATDNAIHHSIKAPTPIIRDVAEWTIVVYIQADNNLAPFADYNINDMQRVGSTKEVNILVQHDQPNNNKTWRYYIGKNNKVEVNSLSQEMGIDPEKELVSMMQWASQSYPAKRYMMVLWNHGNGVSDKHTRQHSILNNWLQIPGMQENIAEKDRGILYDDSQDTFLTNQALTRACDAIKKILGKNIDIVGMDACMMAMVEVAHDIKTSANVLVGSQETEPGEGWPYAGFLGALTSRSPLFGANELASSIVLAYADFYKNDQTCTQSAITLNKIDQVTTTLDNVVREITKCVQANKTESLKMLQTARKKSIAFYVSDYIDLHSFYVGLLGEVQKQRRLLSNTNLRINNTFNSSLSPLETALNAAKKALLDSVSACICGSQYAQAKGMSIYYPKGNVIDNTYPKTSFAKSTQWLSFLKLIGKK